MSLRFGRRSEDMGVGQYIKNGYFWMSGTNKVAVASGSVLKVTLTVASAQPKTITIVGTTLVSDASVFTDIHINPTTALPTTVKRVENAIMDGRTYAGVATLKADVALAASPLSGGTVASASMGVGSTTGGTEAFPGSIIVLPGFTIGFNTVTTVASNIMMTVAWIES